MNNLVHPPIPNKHRFFFVTSFFFSWQETVQITPPHPTLVVTTWTQVPFPQVAHGGVVTDFIYTYYYTFT